MVGAQTGKSAGSVLQQGLLLASGGHVAGMLPFLLVIYAGMLQVGRRLEASSLPLQNKPLQ